MAEESPTVLALSASCGFSQTKPDAISSLSTLGVQMSEATVASLEGEFDDGLQQLSLSPVLAMEGIVGPDVTPEGMRAWRNEVANMRCEVQRLLDSFGRLGTTLTQPELWDSPASVASLTPTPPPTGAKPRTPFRPSCSPLSRLPFSTLPPLGPANMPSSQAPLELHFSTASQVGTPVGHMQRPRGGPLAIWTWPEADALGLQNVELGRMTLDDVERSNREEMVPGTPVDCGVMGGLEEQEGWRLLEDGSEELRAESSTEPFRYSELEPAGPSAAPIDSQGGTQEVASAELKENLEATGSGPSIHSTKESETEPEGAVSHVAGEASSGASQRGGTQSGKPRSPPAARERPSSPDLSPPRTKGSIARDSLTGYSPVYSAKSTQGAEPERAVLAGNSITAIQGRKAKKRGSSSGGKKAGGRRRGVRWWDMEETDDKENGPGTAVSEKQPSPRHSPHHMRAKQLKSCLKAFQQPAAPPARQASASKQSQQAQSARLGTKISGRALRVRGEGPGRVVR